MENNNGTYYKADGILMIILRRNWRTVRRDSGSHCVYVGVIIYARYNTYIQTLWHGSDALFRKWMIHRIACVYIIWESINKIYTHILHFYIMRDIMFIMSAVYGSCCEWTRRDSKESVLHVHASKIIIHTDDNDYCAADCV